MEGVILSSWDYIMGPQIEKLWVMNYNQKLEVYDVPYYLLREFNLSRNLKQGRFDFDIKTNCDLRKFSLMCGQILLGEMDASENSDSASRIYISGTEVLMGVVFRMKTWKYDLTAKEVNNACLCIGFIFKRDYLHLIFQRQFSFDVHLRQLADALQKSKASQEAAIDELSEYVKKLAAYIYFPFQNDLLNTQTHLLLCTEDFLLQTILPAAIVSHLQTSGHTIVLGSSEFKIKRMINVLSLFINEEEFSCALPVSNLVLKSTGSSFYIQGIIKNSERDCQCLLENAFHESLSLTVVDTDLSKVWQTWPFKENIEKKRFCLVTEIGHLVPHLLRNLMLTKNEAEFKIIIKQFMENLMLKAVSVVKTLSHFRNIRRIPSNQEIRKLFEINSPVDLQVILGCAEKLKPGIRCSVL